MRIDVENTGVVPDALRPIYDLVQIQMDHVERILQESLHTKFDFVNRLVRHGFRLGGKRLRPALVFLSGSACGPLRPEHATLAASVELIHTATLAHDDVLDEATIRRHLPTLNHRWDNESAVLFGDYLFAQAMCIAASLADVHIMRLFADACRAVCLGELRQVANRRHFELTEVEYIEIIQAKTAALCACCCEVGARKADATPAHCEAMRRYGQAFGIAFQIMDDILDLSGDEQTAGKSLGTDLAKCKPTLPLIAYLQQASAAERSDLITRFDTPERVSRAEMRDRFEAAGTLDYAAARAKAYVDEALESLHAIPHGDARLALESLVQFAVAREK